jgi:hypothetical protein
MGAKVCTGTPTIDIMVEPDQQMMNNLIQATALVLYGALLIYLLHNVYKYLWVRKRYKVITHSMFYTFALCMTVTRLIEHIASFRYFITYFLRFLNNMADGFSICVGISQVVVIAEIVYAMELFKTEMVEIKSSVDAQMHQAEHLIYQEKKDRQVRRTYLVAFCAIAFTVAEDVSRIFTKCYLMGKGIFVIELFIVGSLMLYYTRRFG